MTSSFRISLRSPYGVRQKTAGFSKQNPRYFSTLNTCDTVHLRFGNTQQSPLVAEDKVMALEKIPQSLPSVPFELGFRSGTHHAMKYALPEISTESFILGIMNVLLNAAQQIESIQEHRGELTDMGKLFLNILEDFLPEEAQNRRFKGEELHKLMYTHVIDRWQRDLQQSIEEKAQAASPTSQTEPMPEENQPQVLQVLDDLAAEDEFVVDTLTEADLATDATAKNDSKKEIKSPKLSTPLAQLLTTFIQSENNTLDRTFGKFIHILLSCEGKPGVPEEITQSAQRIRALRSDIATGISSGKLAKVLEMDSLEGFQSKVSELYDSKKPDSQRQMTEAQYNTVTRMLEMLERTNIHDPSRSTLVNQLHTILYEIPWSRTEIKTSSKAEIRQILDRDHTGLDNVKNKVIDHMGKEMHLDRLRKVDRLAKGDEHPTILCFVGPPGVGKTSIGKSIAEATGRNFVRVALGGVSDEAEIRGHRSTYIAAKPGRIINGLIEAKSRNPVMMLDEIDKLGRDYKGDPAAALLEVLDPEQNKRFRDNFVGIDMDLSQVMFICTANDVSKIPPALKDRMQIIELPGYTTDEKINIAEQHLIPRSRKYNGLSKDSLGLPQEPFNIPRPVLEAIIKTQAPERGVRGLATCINTIAETIASNLSDNPLDQIKLENFPPMSTESLKTYLGPPRFDITTLDPKSTIGQVNGMFFSEGGRPGGTLPIQVRKKVTKNVPPSRAGLHLVSVTGNLKRVMRQSVQRAFDWLDSQPPGQDKTIAELLGLDTTHNRYEVKVAAKDGSTPKDGPSAGAAIALAVISQLTDRPVRGDFAMTGELDIMGNVGKIGGVREKVSGSVEEGAKVIALPEANAVDIDRIPQMVRDQVQIKTVRTMDDVLSLALEKPNTPPNRIKTTFQALYNRFLSRLHAPGKS